MDLGSNTFRLLVGVGDEFGVLLEKKVWQEIPRLSEALIAGGPFKKEARERAFEALEVFAGILAEHPPEKTLACATMAARIASDGKLFVEETRRRHGWETLILSGEEEAFLSATGVLSGLKKNDPDRDNLIFDIGGRSTEFILADARKIKKTLSLPLGVVSLTETFLKNDPPEPGELGALSAFVKEALFPLEDFFDLPFEEDQGHLSPGDPETSRLERVPLFDLCGTAGTVTTIGAMLLGLAEYDPARVNNARMALADVENLLCDLSLEKTAVRAERPGLHPKRADVVVAGLALTAEIARRFSQDYLIVSDNGLLEGIWLKAAGLSESPTPD
jgi:exopolyphosphatase/guanosine-5'-triphosphate,3'-diphosphate pyrophosphatase